MPKESGRKVVATNRKARHDYHVLDTYEAGIALMGTEVKSLREGHASMVDGFCTFYNDELWMEANRPMHGNVVKLSDGYGWWWLYIGHFIHSPFYCYAYAFGELLVLSLYQMAKEQGPAFAPRYEALLRLGGSRSPEALMATVDVDLKSREFWQGGFDAMEKLVAEFERLWAEYSGR